MNDDEDQTDPHYAALLQRRKEVEDRLATLHGDVVHALDEIEFALGIIDRARASLKNSADLLGPTKDH